MRKLIYFIYTLYTDTFHLLTQYFSLLIQGYLNTCLYPFIHRVLLQDLVNSDSDSRRKGREKTFFWQLVLFKSPKTKSDTNPFPIKWFPSPIPYITLRMPLEFSSLNRVVMLKFMRIISEPPQKTSAHCHDRMILSMKSAKRNFKHLGCLGGSVG